MRLHGSLLFSALALVAVIPVPARAQFKEPTQEELKMTSDPKAPGADAVYLNRAESSDDRLHFHEYYERIKVLTEKGKETATIRIPYEHGQFKVTDIRGRTIHADGTVIPLTTKPSDLVDVKTKDYQRNTMVFTLPSVEVGSILEYALVIRYDDNLVSSPVWDVQQPYFVHQAHYYFNPSKTGWITNSRGEALTRLMYGVRANKDAKIVVDANGNYKFDITDVPPIPRDDWMPPLNSVNWRVEFYYTQYTSGPGFWMSEGKRWAKEAERFTNPTKTLQQAVAEIVAPGDTEEQKAHKIYDAVMKLENTRFTREQTAVERKTEKLKTIKTAEDVWNQKSGSDDDMALLFVALGRAAGLKVFPMQVVDRNRRTFDVNYLSTGQLDDYIAILDIGGKETFLDPGQKMCPYGLVHWTHAAAGGIRASDKGPVYGTTPSPMYKQTTVERNADLTLDADNSLTGNLRIVMSGQEALHWRQMAVRNDLEEVKKQFRESAAEYLPDGVEAEFDRFLGIDDPGANLIAVVKVKGSAGTATGKRIFMPGQFFESRGKVPFVAQDKRTVPVDVKYAKLESDQVTYRLPAGMSVESVPTGSDASWPNRALLKVAAETKPNMVTVARTLAYNFTVLQPEDYQDLHDFYQKVATADQQQLVLTRAAIAKVIECRPGQGFDRLAASRRFPCWY
ncbi:MAG TPA: DUF3857 and transglutaminase domain-containing protein [Terracidiphilus sp.]|jgi:hypothetical protein